MVGIMRAAVVLGLFAGTALAEDRALVITNQTYDAAPVRSSANSGDALVQALQRAGFLVLSGADLTSRDGHRLMSQQLAAVRPEDRLVVVLTGQFAQSAGQSWLLGRETFGPDLATIGETSISIATVIEIAARSQGGAVVLLGSEAPLLPLGPGLQPGLGSLQVPQGVTVIEGDAAALADFAGRILVRRGESLPALLAMAPALQAQGFLSPLVPFRPSDGAAPLPDFNAGMTAEDALWRATQAIGTASAYGSYLGQYPQGRHAIEARAEIALLNAEPGRMAQLAEDALALSRDDRRAVQRSLALLGHDPRGIDGVFGPGTRAALSAWQSANGLAVNGYLTGNQVRQLSDQAARRARQLEAEAATRRAQLERQDSLYWDQTGAAGDEAGLRAYLDRYPDGLFADLANRRLVPIDAAHRAEAAAQDRAAWDKARAADTIAAYRAYLDAFPKGVFVAQAQARITALGAVVVPDPAIARAAAIEAGLNLGPLARSLIEGRLDSLGLKPGPADGTFDDQTRRAIRQFQTTRNLPATGYIDQQTMVNLLAGGTFKLGG